MSRMVRQIASRAEREKYVIQILTKELLASQKPTAKSKPGFRLMEHLHFVEQSSWTDSG